MAEGHLPGVPKGSPRVAEDHQPGADKAAEAMDKGVIQSPLPEKICEDVTFEGIGANNIEKAAREMTGGAGPDGVNLDLWERFLTSKQHKGKPAELCQTVADLTQLLNRKMLPPHHLQAFTASRVINLDKKPGVRPIGVGQGLHTVQCRGS